MIMSHNANIHSGEHRLLRFSPHFHSPHFHNAPNPGNFQQNFNNRFNNTFNRFNRFNTFNRFNSYNSSYNYSNWYNWRSYAPRAVTPPWHYRALHNPALPLLQLQQQLNTLLYQGQIEPRYLQFQRWPVEMDPRYVPRLEPYAVRVAQQHNYIPQYRFARNGSYANRYREHPAWRYGTGAEQGPAT